MTDATDYSNEPRYCALPKGDECNGIAHTRTYTKENCFELLKMDYRKWVDENRHASSDLRRRELERLQRQAEIYVGSLFFICWCPRAQKRDAERRGRNVATAGGAVAAQTFDTFDATREPAAYATTKEWAAVASGRDYLVLMPSAQSLGPGAACGKTHLLRAAAAFMAGQGRHIEFVDSDRLRRLAQGLGTFGELKQEAEEDLDLIHRADAVFIDGLGFEAVNKQTSRAVVAAIIDKRGDRPLAMATSFSQASFDATYGSEFTAKLLATARQPTLRGKPYRR